MALFIIYEDKKNTFKMSSWLGKVARMLMILNSWP